MNTKVILAAMVMVAICVGCKNQQPPADTATTQSSQPGPGPIDCVVDRPDRTNPGQGTAIRPVRAGGKTIDALQADNDRLAADNENLKRDLDARLSELTELRKAAASQPVDRETLAGMENQVQLLSKNNAALQAALDRILKSDDGKADGVKELIRQLDDASKSIDGMNVEIARLRDLRRKDRTDLAVSLEEIERLRAMLKDGNDNRAAYARLAADNRALQQTQEDMARGIAALQEETQGLKRDNAAMLKTIDRLHDENSSLQAQLDKVRGPGRGEGDGDNKKIAELIDRLKAAQTQLDRQEKLAAALRDETMQKDKQLKELQKKLESDDGGDRRLAEMQRRIIDLQEKNAQQEKEIQQLNKRLSEKPRSANPPAPDNPPTSQPTPSRQGVVTSVRGDIVTLSMTGVKVGATLIVQRDGRTIGRLIVKSVDGGQVVAQIIDGRSMRGGDKASGGGD